MSKLILQDHMSIEETMIIIIIIIIGITIWTIIEDDDYDIIIYSFHYLYSYCIGVIL